MPDPILPPKHEIARLFAAFRSLGGEADNLMLAAGPHGLALRLERPDAPARLHVPATLLVPTADTMLDDTGALVVKPSSPLPEPLKVFFGDYQRLVGWSSVGRATIERDGAQIARLPAALKRMLEDDAHLGFLFEPDDDARLLKRFIATRHIDWRGKPVFMPMMDLVNHDWRVPNYGFGQAGLTIEGTFPGGEMLVCYNLLDSWQRFIRYGFVSEERFAFSVPMSMRTPSGMLTIGAEPGEAETRAGLPFPRVLRTPEGLTLSHLILGDRLQPDAPRGILMALAREHGLPQPVLAFDRIAHTNRLFFLKLLGLAESDREPAAAFRRLCRLQLEQLSFALGAREIASGSPAVPQGPKATATPSP